MKKLLFFLLWLSPLTVPAQSAVSKFIQGVEEGPGMTIVNISPSMLPMLMEDAEEMTDAEIASLKKNFGGMHLLVVENNPTIFEKFKKAVDLSKYETIISINSDGEYVKMVGNMKDNRLLEFIMVVNDSEGEFVLMSIVGNYSMDEIGKLGALFDMDMEGMFK